ncbi:unnamed protein product [Leptidea sinapis]|uniref:Uncharacterized protein n=1 Tax=Leptidea sinapis TaxID=189913 RepID=A0A5E4Q6X6_9NEOP|nr:unnamed protein product [Leptidea sinapis]
MLRPESPLADHRSLLPRRLLPVKAQIAPVDKKKNRRSLELNPPSNEHAGYDYPKLLISKTTDSLNTECPRKHINKQDSSDSLKRALLAKEEKKTAKESEKKVAKQDSSESVKKALLCRQDSNDSQKRLENESKRQRQDEKRSADVKRGNDKKGLLETDIDDTNYKRIYERRTGCVKPSLPPVAEKGLSPKSPNGSPITPGVTAAAEGVVRWGSGLLSPHEEPKLRPARSWYGYGTLPTDNEKVNITPPMHYIFLNRALSVVLGGTQSKTAAVFRASVVRIQSVLLIVKKHNDATSRRYANKTNPKELDRYQF